MAYYDAWLKSIGNDQKKANKKNYEFISPGAKAVQDKMRSVNTYVQTPNDMDWSYQPDPYSNLEEAPMYNTNPYVFENPSGLVGEPVLQQKKQPGQWHPPMALPREPSPNLPPMRMKPKEPETFPFDGGENIDQAVDWAANKAVEGVPHYLKPKAFSTARNTIESNIQKGVNEKVKSDIQSGIDSAMGKEPKKTERPNPYDLDLKTPNATDDMYPALPDALPQYTPPENPYASLQRPESESPYPESPEFEKYTQTDNKEDQEIRQLLGEDDQLWNLKPLLNLTDNLFGGNLADGYTDPNELAYRRKNQKLTMLNSMAGREVNVKKANNDLKLAEFNLQVAKYKFGEEQDYKYYKEFVEAQRKLDDAKAKVADAQMKRQEKLEEELRKNKRADKIKLGDREFSAEQNRLNREAAKERTLISGSKKKDPKVMTPKEYRDGVIKEFGTEWKDYYAFGRHEPNKKFFKGKAKDEVWKEGKAEYFKRYPSYSENNPTASEFMLKYFREGPAGIDSFPSFQPPVTPSQPPPVSQPSAPTVNPSRDEYIKGRMSEFEDLDKLTPSQLERLKIKLGTEFDKKGS